MNRTYTSQWFGWHSFVNSIRSDFRAHRQGGSARVKILLDDAHKMEDEVFGQPLDGMHVLDIGPGHIPIQLMYFARHNRAMGIDVNPASNRHTPAELFRIGRQSGAMRATKTLGRWLIGSDSRLLRAVEDSFGEHVAWPEVLNRDATETGLPDQSFDLIYSRSVLQHIKNPLLALQEIARMLRPGGGVHLSLHLWTSPNGYTYVPPKAWDWPHLREKAAPHQIDQSRNRMRLSEWRQMAHDTLPGSTIALRGPEFPEMMAAARELQQSELADYSLEELTNYELSIIRKSNQAKP